MCPHIFSTGEPETECHVDFEGLIIVYERVCECVFECSEHGGAEQWRIYHSRGYLITLRSPTELHMHVYYYENSIIYFV